MTCISSSRRAAMIARRDKKIEQRDKLEEAYDAASIELESFTLDTGEARQTSKFRDLEKIGAEIDRLDSQIDRINRQLTNRGLVNMGLRRKGNRYFRGLSV